MATPSRNDIAIKNSMQRNKSKFKEIKIESKEKDPEDVKELIELWRKKKVIEKL